LISEKADRAAIIVTFDCRHLQSVPSTVNTFFQPVVEHTLSRFANRISDEYSGYLTHLWSPDPVALASGVMSSNPGMPVFFVGTFSEGLPKLSPIDFDANVVHLRRPALDYGAGVALSTAPSLLNVLIACALREPLGEELRGKIGLLPDYFLPPGWDSPEKIGDIEPVTLKEESAPEAVAEVKVAQDWQSFLADLEKIPRD
jgi:hypothetical protein